MHKPIQRTPRMRPVAALAIVLAAAALGKMTARRLLVAGTMFERVIIE